MTGVYANVPGHRFAYDVDGTLLRYRMGDGSLQTSTLAAAINDEDTADYIELGNLGAPNFFTTGYAVGHYLTFVFPQARDVVGYWVYAVVQAVTITTHRSDIIQTSPDTTDGSDGTWTTRQTANFPYTNTAFAPRYRDAIQVLTGGTGIKGIRFGFAHDNANGSNNDWMRLYALHLYGTITGSNNGLRFWHPTLDQAVDKAHFDFGDVPQNTTWTKQVRLKNTSSEQANNTVVSAESMTGSPSELAAGLTFSTDNTTFTSTVTITSIAAGAISPIIYVKRTVGAAEAQALRAARVKAIVGSWT